MVSSLLIFITSTVHQEVEKLTKSLQTIAAAQIGLLRRAFQMSVELITEASLKKLLYAFSMVTYSVNRVGQ